MTRALLFILAVHLLACGGAKPGAAKPGDGTAGGSASRPRPTARPPTAPPRPTSPAARPATRASSRSTRRTPSSRPTNAKLKATDTEAAVRFFVIDKDKGPIAGIVISLTAPTGEKYYTAGDRRRGVRGGAGPDRREVRPGLPEPRPARHRRAGRGRQRAAPQPEAHAALQARGPDRPADRGGAERAGAGRARAAVRALGRAVRDRQGHAHRRLARAPRHHRRVPDAQAVGRHRDLGPHRQRRRRQEEQAAVPAARRRGPRLPHRQGHRGSRITAVGYGDERPIASNDTPEGRQENRRIEAMEAM
jgi:hypothetical protein